jgi:hypothetical protein
MMIRFMPAAALGLLLVVGCHSDKPHEYGRQRPPVDQLDSRDRGLQSKDVVAASDQMAMDLLALPELAGASHQWTVVVDRIENLTANRRQDLNIFLERLRVKLAQQGRGRVALIENRDKLRDLQSRELEQGPGDPFQQGGVNRAAPGPAGIQPDYALYGKISELPNRGTSYFFVEFTMTSLKTRQQVWTNAYEVKVER